MADPRFSPNPRLICAANLRKSAVNHKTTDLKRLTRHLLLLLALQLVLAACSSTKSREEQGVIAKLWHNTNAHYNGYFNAREIMDESLVALDAEYQDNYNQRLEMFPFLAVDNPGSVAGELATISGTNSRKFGA